MDYFLEDLNVKITEDCDVFGQPVKAGTKLTFLSRQGNYKGRKMRIPPPEFEALIFFTALDSAAQAEKFKKKVKVGKSNFDGLQEVQIDKENQTNFFTVCQNAMATIAFSISAIESWTNKSIVVYGQKKGQPSELTLKRPNKPDRKVFSNSVPSDLGIPIRPKIFQLIPQVFSVKPLKEHSTLKQQLVDIIDERNIIMHMQNKLKIADFEVERVGYAIKLFKTNTFLSPKTVLNYFDYLYKRSDIEEPLWISAAKKRLKILKKGLK